MLDFNKVLINIFRIFLISLCIPNLILGQCNNDESELIIDIQFANYSYEISFELYLNSTIIESEDDFNSSFNFEQHQYTYCLASGEYNFVINDSWGDGLECFFCGWQQDDGNLSLTLDNEEIFFVEGDFGYQTNHSFLINNIIYGCLDTDASNYNPDANYDDNSCEYFGCTDLSYIEAHNYEVTPFGYQILPYDPNYVYATIDDGSCENLMVWGCTDPNYLEYDSISNILSNDMCSTLIIEGCNDQIACNFDSEVNYNDGSCSYAEDYYDCEGNCINDHDSDGVCDELEILGCTNPNGSNYINIATEDDGTCILLGCMDQQACNWDSEANTDDESCFYSETYFDCNGNCINDSDEDNICDELEVPGCTDISACNFNPYATDDDDSCETSSCYGCGMPEACNYNAMTLYPTPNCIFASDVSDCAYCSGEIDGTGTIIDNDIDGDGVCDGDEIAGCMNTTACNFNSDATNDDDSCEFTSCSGCTNSNACNYDPLAILDNESCIYPEIYYNCDGTCSLDDDNDGVCNELEIIGCSNISACNYNPNATDEDECIFALQYYDCNDNCINDDNGNLICDELEVFGCMIPDACNYNSDANFSDNSCEFAEEYFDCMGNCLNDLNLNGICDELEIGGCTDTDACNYDSNSNVNDGSCEYSEEYLDCLGNCINDSNNNGICDELEVGGCTDTDACNYNSDATMDDGTCEYLEVSLQYNNVSLLLEVISNASSPTYLWNVNGENTNINSDRISPFINGLYTVSVYDEENDCWGEASYTINNVSIDEVSLEIKIFPNPVHNTLHMTSKLNNQHATIEVYNYLGYLCDIYQNINSKYAQIDISKLSSGIYILKLKSQDFIIQKEFIKF